MTTTTRRLRVDPTTGATVLDAKRAQQRVASPSQKVAKRGASAKADTNATPSKADRVRALLDEGKSIKDIAAALDDVTWSYAWDVAAAHEKKTGKVFIPSHAPKARRTSKARTTTKAEAPSSPGMPRDAETPRDLASRTSEGAHR